MRPGIPKFVVARIIGKADLVKLMQHYNVQLKIISKNMAKAVCFMHDDHDPSLNINRNEHLYYCFVCQEGGNAITLVKHMEKIHYFYDVVERLAELVGTNLKEEIKKYAEERRACKNKKALNPEWKNISTSFGDHPSYSSSLRPNGG